MKITIVVFGTVGLLALAMVGLRGTLNVLVNQAAGRTVESASVHVQFALTDPQGRPVPDAAVRLVFGRGPDRQPASAGERLATDANGTITLNTTTVIDKVQKTVPSNFISSLFDRPKLADHLAVAAELSYMSYRWLYAADLYRIVEDGTLLADGLTVFTPDAEGNFSNRVTLDNGGWRMKELGGMVLTTPGNELASFALDRQADTKDQWNLTLAFKRSPDAVQR